MPSGWMPPWHSCSSWPRKGLVSARSLHVDEGNGMVSFAYSCGALGGVLVEDPDEENTPFALSELPAVDLHEMSNAPQGDLAAP